MIELNITNFITVGIMAMIFFAMVEIAKKKFSKTEKQEVK